MRKPTLSTVALAVVCFAAAPASAGASPISLTLSQGYAFSILGRSCGGIQEQVYATGFATDGYPTGAAYLQTRCGGSGRGGGYKTTTYTAWASVRWDWLGETLSAAALPGGPEGISTTFSAEDTHGDRIYNTGTQAFLETGEPPLRRPLAPAEVTAAVGLYESGETEYLGMSVGWVNDAATANLLSSSTVTATPVKSGAPVLTQTVGGAWSSALLSPVAPDTTYVVTVTSTDPEGTSESSPPIEVTSPNSDGEGKHQQNTEICESDQGTIKLSPGLSETPQVQNMTVKGVLGGCDGPLGMESGRYVEHLRTSGEVTCSTLEEASLEPTTIPVSLSVKWSPSEEGTSKGAIVLPLSEVSLTGLSGSLEGGPFSSPTAVTAAGLWESYAGGSTCGQASGKKKAKPVKNGSFATSAVEIE